MSRGARLAGTTGDLNGDGLWVLDENHEDNGDTFYLPGGPAQINGDEWAYDDHPVGDQVPDMAAIVVYRANLRCNETLRTTPLNSDGDRYITPKRLAEGTCRQVGRVTVAVTQP